MSSKLEKEVWKVLEIVKDLIELFKNLCDFDVNLKEVFEDQMKFESDLSEMKKRSQLIRK